MSQEIPILGSIRDHRGAVLSVAFHPKRTYSCNRQPRQPHEVVAAVRRQPVIELYGD